MANYCLFVLTGVWYYISTISLWSPITLLPLKLLIAPVTHPRIDMQTSLPVRFSPQYIMLHRFFAKMLLIARATSMFVHKCVDLHLVMPPLN